MFIDSVDEFDALHEIRQVVVAAKFAPAPGGTLSKLEHHCQTGFRAAVAFGLAVSQADRGERAFDRRFLSSHIKTFQLNLQKRTIA